MPTPTKGPRLGGGPAHERLILANLAQALFENDRITTTQAKAKRLRPLAERLVTFAKRGDLHARRRVLAVISDKGVVHRLFTEIAPDVVDRQGGYTRITKIEPRKGDNAPMAVIELVREPMSARQATVREAEAATRRTAGATSGTQSGATPSAASEPTPPATSSEASTQTSQAAAAAAAEISAQDAQDALEQGDAEAAMDAAADATAAADTVAELAPGSQDAAAADAAADYADDAAEAAVEQVSGGPAGASPAVPSDGADERA